MPAILIAIVVIIGKVVTANIIIFGKGVVIHIIYVIYVWLTIGIDCSAFVMFSIAGITFVLSSATVTVSFTISLVNVTGVVGSTLSTQVSLDGH